MARYIDADKLTYSRVRIIHSDGTMGGWNAVVMSSVIKDAPAADVVEVRHGEWIKAGVGITERIVCSACNSSKGYFGRPPFCNQCGAKMDSKRKEQSDV